MWYTQVTRYLKSDKDHNAECSDDNELNDVNNELSRPVHSEWHSRHTQLTTTLQLTTTQQPTGDHYVGKQSATGQSTRPTQPFIPPGSINEYQAWFPYVCQVAPSGECLRGIGPPDRMLAAPWCCLFLAAFWAIPGTWLLLSCVTV